MGWYQTCNKPLLESSMIMLTDTHTGITKPQWVNSSFTGLLTLQMTLQRVSSLLLMPGLLVSPTHQQPCFRIFGSQHQGSCAVSELTYFQTSHIRCTLVSNKIVDPLEVVGASPIGTAPTTSSFSTEHLASMDWAKTTARRDENPLSFVIWCTLY